MKDKNSATEFTINADKRSYVHWFLRQYQCGYAPSDIRKRRIEVFKRIMDGELTEKQRTYMSEYLLEDLCVTEISERHGVDRSTVTRTIERGFKRIYKTLYYLAPEIGIPTDERDAPNAQLFFYDRTTGRQIRKRRNKDHATTKSIRSVTR